MPKTVTPQQNTAAPITGRFLTSKEVRAFIKPLPDHLFWRFKKDPRFPKPFLGGNGGRNIYLKADIEAFLDAVSEDQKPYRVGP